MLKNDKFFHLLDLKYFQRIRRTILDHGKINIQMLATKFNIKAGNTYFRRFIQDNDQDYLGQTSLTSLLDACGYDLKIVPIKRNNENIIQEIDNITDIAFDDILKTVSKFASESKKSEVKKVKKVKDQIKNTNAIADAMFNTGLDDDDDDDEIYIGTI